MLTFILIFVAVILSLMAFGAVPAERGVVAVGVAVTATGIFVWSVRRMHQGVIELSQTHLILRSRGGKHVYRWEHIDDLRVRTFAEVGGVTELWSRFWGVDVNEPFVEVRLNRSLRLGLWPFQFGTDIAGPSSAGFRTVRLHVEDPDGFVREARRYLSWRQRQSGSI